MKLLRTPVAALALSLLAPSAIVLGTATLPMAAQAKAKAPARAAPPEVERLEVTSDGGLQPGSELNFLLQGTPGGTASLRLTANRPITVTLKETERGSGMYAGSYTIKRTDRIAAGNAVRVTLRKGSASTTSNFNVPGDAAPPAPPPQAQPAPAPAPRIERFTASPVNRFMPGAELKFSLEGLPGSQASFSLGGIADNVPMREVRAGVYEGAYTLRRQDRMTLETPVVATLKSPSGQSVTSRLSQPMVSDTTPPQVLNVTPREGERVPAGLVFVSGNLEDGGGTGVDPKSVTVTLGGRNVTADAQVNAQSFSYRGNLPPGRYDVMVTARDTAGNPVRKAWSFDVLTADGSVPGVAPAPLAIQLLSPTGTVIDGQNVVTVRGRTAPNASVAARVVGLLQITGPVGIEREVLSQTLQADANGNFSFSFQPAVASGATYDVMMVARKDGRSEELRTKLTQR